MPPFTPPSEAEMLILKRELNFLLWTQDPPPLPSDFASQIACESAPERATINMQCTAHALITGVLLHRRGYRVVGRGGAAYLCDIEPGQDMSKDLLNQIARHWWITANDELADLSLYAESENPLIFRNRSVGGRWLVKFKDARSDWMPHLTAFQTNRTRGVLYVSTAKRAFTDGILANDTAQAFPPAEAQGVALTYSAIIEHCDRLLRNTTDSLTVMAQIDAWRSLV